MYNTTRDQLLGNMHLQFALDNISNTPEHILAYLTGMRAAALLTGELNIVGKKEFLSMLTREISLMKHRMIMFGSL